MGCDIHLYFEKKVKDKWERIPVGEVICPRDRDYELFSFLAGVRYLCHETYRPQFEDRGIPEDTSLVLEKPKVDDGIWMGDHSFTYAYLDEIIDAPWEEAGLYDCYFHIFCAYVLPRLSFDYGYMTKEESRNVRVIMGFDN